MHWEGGDSYELMGHIRVGREHFLCKDRFLLCLRVSNGSFTFAARGPDLQNLGLVCPPVCDLRLRLRLRVAAVATEATCASVYP